MYHGLVYHLTDCRSHYVDPGLLLLVRLTPWNKLKGIPRANVPCRLTLLGSDPISGINDKLQRCDSSRYDACAGSKYLFVMILQPRRKTACVITSHQGDNVVLVEAQASPHLVL